jgi:O-antigen/teichoic acid export membrane protein
MNLDLFKKLFKHETASLKLKTFRSAFWSIAGKGSENLIRIAGNLVLTRILFPEAFGLMAIANVVIMVVALFADMGVSVSIIQNPRGAEKEFIDTSWIISISRGIILWLIISVLAWPASLFYTEPQLVWILLIMALSPLVHGFQNPALPLLVKKFQLEKQVMMDIATQIIGLLTTIILALIIGSVYSLAIGHVVSYALKVLVSYMVIKYRPSLKWNKTAGHDLIHFGRHIIVNTIITVLINQLDVLIMGKMLTMEDISFYNIGKNFGVLLYTFCVQMLNQSYMAAVSSVQSDMERVQRIYRKTITLLIAVLVPLSMSLALFSHDIIKLLYDPRYELSYISMYWIGLAGIFRTIMAVTGVTFFALGRPFLETISKIFALVPFIILLPFAIRNGGLSGGAICVASAFVFMPIVASILLKFSFNFSTKIIIQTWMQAIVTTFLCYLVFIMLHPYLNSKECYNMPFAFISGLLFLSISGVIYWVLEGKKSFLEEMFRKK